MLQMKAGILREMPGGLCRLCQAGEGWGPRRQDGDSIQSTLPWGVTVLLLCLGSCKGAKEMLHGCKLQPLAVPYSLQ